MELTWRPSRPLAAALAALGMLAAVSLHASDLPAWIATLGTPACIGWGIVSAARTLGARPARLAVAQGRATLDGMPVHDLRVDWRGPLAFPAWRDARGKRHCRAWWPGALPAGGRRELRLAVAGDEYTAGRRSMAG